MTNDEREIRELVTTWMTASKAGDADKVLSLMADDVVFLVAGQSPMIGKAAFAASMKAQQSPESPKMEGSSEIKEIKILGDWAFMWTQLRLVVTPPGGVPSIRREGPTLSILKKEHGRWVLARDANLLTVVR